MVKAPTRAFSLLKALTTAFTFNTLLGPQAFFAEESINSFGFLPEIIGMDIESGTC